MGLLRMAARTAVVAGTASAVAGGVRHRQDEKWAAQDQAQYEQQQNAQQAAAYQQMMAQQQAAAAAPPAPAAPAAPAANDPIAELQRLADLKAQGIINDEEFAAMKAKVIGA
jgi:hypothetical protein